MSLLQLPTKLEGSNKFLEIQSLDSNFTQGSSGQLQLASSVSITSNLTVGGEFTADKINIDEFVFPDNQTEGLKFTCADATAFMIFKS